MNLIYHKLDSHESISPFDQELIKIAKGNDIRLISPYISLSYIKRLTNLSKSWKVITDFEAWIISQPTQKLRHDVCKFIIENIENIKHIGDIHAKVLVTEFKAFLGSANFTERGILQRTELSISFSDQEEVHELNDWFNNLWALGSKIEEELLLKFIAQNEHVKATPSIIKLDFPLQPLNNKANLASINITITKQRDFELDLIRAIIKTKNSKDWFKKYFDLVNDFINEFDLKADSPKIGMSVTKNLKMPINIGQRYVICPSFTKKSIGFILPLEFQEVLNDYNQVISKGKFYDKSGNPEALWVNFDSQILFLDDYNLIINWKKAIKKEVDRTKNSPYRKFHNPNYYEASVNSSYRSKLFEKIDAN